VTGDPPDDIDRDVVQEAMIAKAARALAAERLAAGDFAGAAIAQQIASDADKASAAGLIMPESAPAGCELIELSDPRTGQVAVRLVGRDAGQLDASASPCGCDDVRCYRFPTSGLAMPGEDSPVGVLHWCPEHGEVTYGMQPAMDLEREWRWHQPRQT
jgi:hypothetical protein